MATKQGVKDWQNGYTLEQCENITTKIVAEIKRRHELLPEKYKEKREIPVSVKTRVGFNEPVIKEWVTNLLECEPAAIAIHGRTLTQHYSGTANWENIAEAAELIRPTSTLVLGNGDIPTLELAHEHVKKYGVDGVLIGRGAFGNPYVFAEEPGPKSVFEIALEHSRLFEETYSYKERYSFLPMRKHLGWYVKAIPGASEIRVALFKSENSQDVENIFRQYELIG